MINENLKELRKSKCLSQKEISKILGIAQTTYAGYETGKHKPDLEMLIKIADFYMISVDFLIGRLIITSNNQ